MKRITIDDTMSDAAVEAILRARLARFDVCVLSVSHDYHVVRIKTRQAVYGFPATTKRAAMLAALEFNP